MSGPQLIASNAPESDSTELHQTLALPCRSKHGLFGKPVSSFPDHVLWMQSQALAHDAKT
jgi:hypothetical protein